VILSLAATIEEEKIAPDGLEMVELDGFEAHEFHCLTLKGLKRINAISQYEYYCSRGGHQLLSIEIQPKLIIDTANKLKGSKTS
jgi:hypothetical protein